MIAVVDLGISNIGSVVRALQRVGASPRVTRDPAAVAQSSGVVLPGVGAFGDGMASLHAAGLVGPLRRVAADGVRVVGICLGLQLLATRSEEHGDHEGLGLLHGHVRRLRPHGPAFRVPNVGWCDLRLRASQDLLPDEVDGRSVYFTHSYHLVCDDPDDVAATIDFGPGRVVAAVRHGNLCGVQFHPERSQDAGLTILLALLAASTTPAPGPA